MKRQKRGNKKSFQIKIKEAENPKLIAIERIVEDDYPLFCFRYLSDVSFKKCKDATVFIDFLSRLQKLSDLGWKEIRLSQRHGFGMEPIPKSEIIPKLPACVTPDVSSLHVLRANGNNLPFIGLQVGVVFRVLFIETQFGDIYKH